VNATDSITNQYSFSATTTLVDQLEIHVATYDFSGKLLKFGEMTNELSLCKLSMYDIQSIGKFGNTYKVDCTFELLEYFEKNALSKARFYELYLKQKDGSYTDIPIAINGMLKTDKLKSNLSKFDYTNLALRRRYFLVDQITGIVGAASVFPTTTPETIQYLSSISLIINKVESASSTIYRPYAYLTYTFATATALQAGTTTTGAGSISTIYLSGNSSFWSTIKILFIVMHIFIGMIWFFRIYIWHCYNPEIYFPEYYCITRTFKAFLLLTETWVFANFIFLFGVSCYWFFVFKLQSQLYVFMPSEGDDPDSYSSFKTLFWVMFSGFIVNWLDVMLEQTDVDIFFIDWEKIKEFNSGKDPNLNQAE
jgi:hypothetical protein